MARSSQATRTFWGRVAHVARAISAPTSARTANPGRIRQAATTSHDRGSTEVAEIFARRLRALIKSRKSVTAGAVHVINLDRVKSTLESTGRWKTLAERVESMCVSVISGRLDPDDLVMPFPGPAFFIAFSRLGKTEARAKCALIAAEIERRLISWDPSLRAIRVGAAVMELEKGEKPIDTIDVSKEIEKLVTEAETTVIGDDEIRPGAKEKGKVIGYDGGDAEEDDDPDPVWDTVEREIKAFDNPWVVEIPDSEKDDAEEKSDWYYEKRPDRPPGLTFLYIPMWHVRYHTVGSYLCLPAITVSRSQILVGDAIYAAAPPLLVCRIDVEILGQVKKDFEKLLAAGKQVSISAPVHFETLARAKERRHFLAACKELTDVMRQHLVLELVDLPECAPTPRLAELLSYLRPYARAFNLRTSLDRTQFENLAEANVHAAGIALGRESGPEAETIQKMNAFTVAAERLGLRTYVFELPSRSLSSAARGAGFDYISGTAVGPALDAPEAVYSFDTLDLYAGVVQ